MRLNKYIVLLACLACLLSCQRIPLHDPDSGVYLKLELKLNVDVAVPAAIDLSRHPDLAAKVNISKPQTVHVCFYDPETHKLVAEDFLEGEGGFVHLSPGEYDMIVYGLGNEVTQVDGTQTRGAARAFTSALGTRVKVNKAEAEEQQTEFDVIYEPDHLLVGRKERVTIPVHAADEGSVIVIDDEMETLLETYAFSMPNVSGVENLKSVDIYITGQAPSRYLWDKRYPSRAVAIQFSGVLDAEDGGISSVFNTFGKFPDIRSQVYLYMMFTGEGGQQYQYVQDVTEQFNNPDNSGHEIVIDEPIEIPEGGGGEAGFNPTVGDWQVEVIDIPID